MSFVEVKQSTIQGAGHGLFAANGAGQGVIPAGTTLTQYPGQIVSMQQFFYLDAEHHPAVHYTLFRSERGILVVLKDFAENSNVDLSACGHKVNDALTTIGPHLGALLAELEKAKSDNGGDDNSGAVRLSDSQVQEIEAEFLELVVKYQQCRLESELGAGLDDGEDNTAGDMWNAEVEDIEVKDEEEEGSATETGEEKKEEAKKEKKRKWKTVMKTTRDIQPGEEIFFQYGLQYWASRSYSPLYWSPRASTATKKLAWKLRKITASIVASTSSAAPGGSDDSDLPALPRRVGLMQAQGEGEDSSSGEGTQLLVDLDMAPTLENIGATNPAQGDSENNNTRLESFYKQLQAATIRDADLSLVMMDLFGRSEQMMRLQKLPAAAKRQLVVAYLKKAATSGGGGGGE